jgi:LPXTG-site transpeptidase (sortase) family protein
MGRLDRRKLIVRARQIVCLVLGVAALGWLISDRLGAARDQRNWARELEARLATRQSLNGVAPAMATSNLRPIGTAGTTSGIIGRLEAHRLGISVITREGTDASTLERAIGHIANTALPGEAGNAAFAGHRDTFFRRLRYVRAGDRIIITTVSGRHEYVVRDTRVVSPTDVSVLDPTPTPTLTLVTCFPFRYIGPAPERFIVRADLLQNAAR